MPPGRRLGTAAVKAEQQRRAFMAQKGDAISAEAAKQMKLQLSAFKTKLEKFAVDHKKEIQSDPVFRAKFHEMCASIGVDPLTSRKGVWADLLGVGDFYYELAVRIVEICVATRPLNGGIISLDELVTALKTRRLTYTEKISTDDVERAVAKLGVLGSGYTIVTAGNKRIVRSVPVELSLDHTNALSVCENGYTSATNLQKSMGWSTQRTNDTLKFLLDNEIAWLDSQSSPETYWILGLVPGASSKA